MDRDETVRISRLANFGGLTESDASILLMSYCLEHEKPYYETNMFVIKVLSDENLLRHCFNTALEYYERKFTVFKLWSSPDSNPLNNQGLRKLLQIF